MAMVEYGNEDCSEITQIIKRDNYQLVRRSPVVTIYLAQRAG